MAALASARMRPRVPPMRCASQPIAKVEATLMIWRLMNRVPISASSTPRSRNHTGQ
jgi:hypothetical protein